VSNCTGVIYGKVTSQQGGGAVSGAEVDLNWITRAEGGALQVAGDDNLSKYVPRVKTTSKGEYVIPFFWASTQVPGSTASVLGIQFYSDFSYRSRNVHGNVVLSLDLRKLFGLVAPPIPSSAPDAATMFLNFYTAAPQLKALSPLTRLFSASFISVEQQGLYARIDVALP